eukprot:scaffold1484_cov118-Isochrysis_galbana.AAC.1
MTGCGGARGVFIGLTLQQSQLRGKRCTTAPATHCAGLLGGMARCVGPDGYETVGERSDRRQLEGARYPRLVLEQHLDVLRLVQQKRLQCVVRQQPPGRCHVHPGQVHKYNNPRVGRHVLAGQAASNLPAVLPVFRAGSLLHHRRHGVHAPRLPPPQSEDINSWRSQDGAASGPSTPSAYRNACTVPPRCIASSAHEPRDTGGVDPALFSSWAGARADARGEREPWCSRQDCRARAQKQPNSGASPALGGRESGASSAQGWWESGVFPSPAP